MNWYKQSQEIAEEIQSPYLDPITPQQWQEINDRMIAKDYDFRGAEDAKKIYYRLNQTSGGLPKDHTDVLNAVVNNKEYIKKIDPKEYQKVTQKAIRMFGLTNNLKEAGYILPNGRLLDFSGVRQGSRFPNTRALDHREIQKIMPMQEFISMGCIRHFPEQPGVDIRRKPTSQQLNIIEQEANNSPSGYTVEIQDPMKGRFYRQYDEGTKGTKIVYDILRFYGLHQGLNRGWYKIAIDINSLTRLATQFRKQMVQCYDDECLRSQCLPVSRKLKNFLLSKGYNTAIVVQGVFRVDNPDSSVTEDWDPNDFESPEEMEEATYTPLHYWVEVNDIIIDITTDQFNDELDEPVSPVEVGTYQELGRYTAIHKDWI